MKYFTAELLSRYGSDDPAVYQPALEEWEQARERYGNYLDAIKAQMSLGLRQIEETYYLHDAKVRAMGKQGRSFIMMLQLDPPPHVLLTLAFDLIAEPVIDPAKLPRELCSTGDIVEWQYDELELISGEPRYWSWTILLSNGWEVTLHFADVRIEELQAMIPAPRDGELHAPAPSVSLPA